jgi:hypothetical protein
MEESELNEIKELEAEMKKLNLYMINKSEISDDYYLAVEVDIDCVVKLPFMKTLALAKKVMRGSTYYVTFDDSKDGTLTLKIGVKLPKDFIHTYKSTDFSALGIRATTFPDLCWINSNGTTNQTLEEVVTKQRDNVEVGDLTWTLPSKFVDDFVEMMHTLNLSIISGLMQDAIIYGPFIYSKKRIE